MIDGNPKTKAPTIVHADVNQHGEAVFSPSWSMHSGVGTDDYRFVWSMGGENLEFDDMDVLSLVELG